MIQKQFSGLNFEQIYIDILKEIVNNCEYLVKDKRSYREISNLMFNMYVNTKDKRNFTVELKSRSFKFEFAQKFFEWMMSGSQDISELYKHNENAKKFDEVNTGLPDNFSTAYGPRIVRQLPAIIKLLKTEPSTRRAFLHILGEQDKVLYEVQSKLEYPCTVGIGFMIRNGKLDISVMMRSNNMVTTVCYDVYNFIKLQMHVANVLKIPTGAYSHFAASSHIFEDEIELAKKIIDEYDKKNLKKSRYLQKTIFS